VDPVRAGGQRDVESVVHEEELTARPADRSERPREREEIAPAEVLLSQVHRDAPGRDPGERRVGADREIGRDPAIGDQVDNGERHP
jgi:hypothetical protein